MNKFTNKFLYYILPKINKVVGVATLNASFSKSIIITDGEYICLCKAGRGHTQQVLCLGFSQTWLY